MMRKGLPPVHGLKDCESVMDLVSLEFLIDYLLQEPINHPVLYAAHGNERERNRYNRAELYASATKVRFCSTLIITSHSAAVLI